MPLKWFFLSNRAVKLTFEKKNQKTNASINHLRKKLEKYHKAVLVSGLSSVGECVIVFGSPFCV